MATRINQFSSQSVVATAKVDRNQPLQTNSPTKAEPANDARGDIGAEIADKLKASKAEGKKALQDHVDTSQAARRAEAKDRLDSGRQVEQREAADELQRANKDVAEAQDAKRALEDGRQALEELEEAANARVSGNEIAEDRADSLRIRINDAEENASVQAQQQRRRTETKEAEAPPAPPAAEQREASTLSLLASGQAASGSGPPPPEAAEPIVSPRTTDISTPEAALETRDAVGDAINRTRSLEDQVSRFGNEAVERTETATSKLREGASRPPLTSTEDAQETADEVARSTIDDAGRASASQPFLNVEAALRVLS